MRSTATIYYNITMNAFPIIISSPSGAGKTTIIEAVLKRNKTVSRVVTATTRAPRKGEKDGKDYHFWTIKQFEQAIKKNQMLEWAQVHTHYYGIPKRSVDSLMKKGICPILVIDVQGARTVKEQYPQAALVFIVPPSLKELKKRILGRHDNTQDIALRLETAKKEIREIDKYDYVLLNDDLKEAVNTMAGIIAAEQCRVVRHDSKKLKNLK